MACSRAASAFVVRRAVSQTSRLPSQVQSSLAAAFTTTATRLYASSSSSSPHNNDISSPPSESSSSVAPLKSFVSFPAYEMASSTTSQNTPDVWHLEPGRRVVCIGDVHGDYNALTEFLEIAGVYNAKSNEWVGHDTICIQLGDIFDRGHHELACCELLASLSRQAPLHGGAVQVLYGNHEALNAVGLFQYAVGDDEFEEVLGKPMDMVMNHTTNVNWRLQFAGNQPVRWASLEPGGLLSETFMASLKVAVVVGRTLCVHAGLTSQHLQDYGGIAGMNQQAQDWILHQWHTSNCNDGSQFETVDDVRQQAQLRAKAASDSMPECLGGGIGSHSPVWMRDYSQPNDSPPRNPKAQDMIDSVLTETNCHRMVMGHTPQFKINAALQGKAWRVDVGAAQGVMGGTPEVLEIIRGQDTDEVNVLTRNGKVPAVDRQTVESGILF